MTADGRVTWVRSIPRDTPAISHTAAGLWLQRGDSILLLADGSATAQKVYTWTAGTDTEGNCETRASVAAADGSAWLVACHTALHLLLDGSAVAVPVPRCFAWSAATAPDGRLYLAGDNRVLRLSGAGASTERWDDTFAERTSLFSESMAVTPDGALWMAERWHGTLLRRPPPGDAIASPLSVALRFTSALGRFVGVAVDRRGVAWLGSPRGLVRMARDGTVTTAPVAEGVGDVSTAGGRVWFIAGQRAVGVRRAGTTRIVLRTPRPSALAGVAAAPDGSAWITDPGRRRIGHVAESGSVAWYTRGLAHVGGLIGVSATGRAGAWFVAQSGWVGRVDRRGRIRLWRTRPNANPVDIAVDQRGAAWFTEFGRHRVGRLDRRGRIHEHDLGYALDPTTIVAGADHAMWTLTASPFPESTDTGIARVSASGRVTPYFVRGTEVAPAFGLGAAPDGTLLFALDGGPTALGRFDPRLDPTLRPG